MANRFWVGGTGAWDGTAGTKWALTSGGAGGQAVPTSADDVFFDASSGAGTVTISAGNTGAKSITCTGFTGTLAGSDAISVAGSITLVAGQTYSYTGDITLTATGTLTTGGKTLSNLIINASGGTVTLGSALTCNAFTLSLGTFTTSASNFAFTVNSLTATSGSLTLNSSTVTTTGNWSVSSAVTASFASSTINIGAQATTFNGGAKTYGTVSFLGTTSTIVGITDANTFTSLSFTAPASGVTKSFSFDSNQTITTLTCAGSSVISRIFLLSNTIGTARTLTVGTYATKSNVDFRDITAAGTSAPWSGTSIGDCGGNTSITATTPKTVYWNLTGTQSWSATAWATSSGGTPALANFPLAQDTAIFDNTGAVTTVQLGNNAYNIGTIDMSARTSAMTLDNSPTGSPAIIYGNFKNGSGTTATGGTTGYVFSGRSTQTILSSGKSFPGQIVINSPSTVQLSDALTISLTSTPAISHTNGTIDLNGFTLTAYGYLTNTGTKNITFNNGTLTLTGTGNIFNNAVPTGFTTSAGTGTGTISLTSASNKTFTGGGSVYNCILNQGGAGILVIAGTNTFNDISNSYSATGATTITLSANQTVYAFSATGTVGKVLTLNSDTGTVQRTITKTSGVVGVDYLSIRDSNVTGGAAFYAGANSTNVSNNTGWIFTAVPASVAGNFMIMFL